MSITSILKSLPDYVPKSRIRQEATISIVRLTESALDENFLSAGILRTGYLGDTEVKTFYRLPKSPVESLVSVECIVNGVSRTLTPGDGIELQDTNGDGDYDSVAFIDQDRLPDIGTNAEVTYVVEPVISRYVRSFEDDAKFVSASIDEVYESKYIETASGKTLDRIGKRFGRLGVRLQRNDEAYRAYLRSIIDAYDANGTRGGIKFAVASAVRSQPENVTIQEDFQKTGFRVFIDYLDRPMQVSAINELIQLAKPSGVELLGPPILQNEEATIGIKTAGVTVEARLFGLSTHTLGEGTLIGESEFYDLEDGVLVSTDELGDAELT